MKYVGKKTIASMTKRSTKNVFAVFDPQEDRFVHAEYTTSKTVPDSTADGVGIIVLPDSTMKDVAWEVTKALRFKRLNENGGPKKMSFHDFTMAMMAAHKSGKDVSGVIVFTEDSFDKPFTVTERSYRVESWAKYFDPDKCGTSLFGDCLDETDEGVRLDHLMHSGWTPDYCYIEPNIEA